MIQSTASTPPGPCVAANDTVERLRARSRAVGALVMTAFGMLWAGMAASATGAAALVWLAVALVAVALVLPAAQRIRANPADAGPLPADVAARLRRGHRVFKWAFGGEIVAILVATNLVANLGHPQWQPAVVMAIVGLHFLPLAVGFAYRPHWVTGAAMTAWALGYPWLFAAGAMAPAGPLVAAAMLFASAAWALRPPVPARG